MELGLAGTIVRVGLGVAAAYVLTATLVFIFQRHLMYHPGPANPAPAAVGLGNAETVAIETADRISLLAWYVPPPADAPVIVLFHGNAGNIADRGFKAETYAEAGFGVLMPEYRGFGGVPGKPTERGLFADADAVAFFLDSRGIAPRRRVFYGESLGSAVALYAAVRAARAGRPAGAVVLEAPFTSMGDAGAYHYPWLPARLLVRDRYDNLSRIGDIGCPLLVVHGKRDRTVPFSQGQRLFEQAHDPKSLVPYEDGGHMDLYDHGAAETIVRFLRDHAFQPSDR